MSDAGGGRHADGDAAAAAPASGASKNTSARCRRWPASTSTCRAGAGDCAGRRQRRRQVGADQMHRRHPRSRMPARSSGRAQPVRIRSPRDAAALGIEVVYQDLALCDNLDVVQNMFLGRERLKNGLLDEDDMERAAAKTLAGLQRDHAALDPRHGRLAVGRPAPVDRRRQGGDVELEARHPRRADRRARRGADQAGAGTRPAAGRSGPRGRS